MAATDDTSLPLAAADLSYFPGEGWSIIWKIKFPEFDGPSEAFTAEQMREYARQAVLQERERCASLCEAQIAIYDAKIEKAMKDGDDKRWDRLDCYKEAVENIAAAIRKG